MTPEEQAELRKSLYNASVVHLKKLHSDLMIMRVRPDFDLPPIKPGQYTTLGLGFWEPRFPGCQDEAAIAGDEDRLARRAYSISCSILDEEGMLLTTEETSKNLEFYVVLVRDASRESPPALTPRLFMLRQGDRLALGEKVIGNYNADPVKSQETAIFLSTGTGEAPHNYMLWQLLRQGHQGRILSACCVRYRRDLGYLSVHQKLMKRYPKYSYLSLTTREADTLPNKMYIQDLITSGRLEDCLGGKLDPASTHVFLCGNPNMIGVPIKERQTGERTYPSPTGVVEILEKRGFQVDQPQAKIQGNIHFEEYW